MKKKIKKQLTMVSLFKNALCDVTFVIYDDELKFMSVNFNVQSFAWH